MWNERFATEEYLFGKAPSQFMVAQAEYLVGAQTALSIADGEGRNSVFMVEQGLEVTAMEHSPNAIEKAQKLANERGVVVTFQEADIFNYDWDEAQYDRVVGVFFQFMGAEARAGIFDGIKRACAPGGLVMLHGYTPEQLAHGTGGPRAVENLYTPEILSRAFEGWDILRLEAYETELDEGAGHAGLSALIDLVARKPL